MISGMVHLRSKACTIRYPFTRSICLSNSTIRCYVLETDPCREDPAASYSLTFDRTILKIFWTLMECEVEQKIKGAFIALANRRDCRERDVERTR